MLFDVTGKHGAIVYSSNGLLIVICDHGRWLVPPGTFLVLGRQVEYRLTMATHVKHKSINLASGFNYVRCFDNVYKMTPLMQELFVSLEKMGSSLQANTHNILLSDLLNNSQPWSGPSNLGFLERPKDQRVSLICNYVQNNLDSPRTLREWANKLNYDTRTLHRLFVSEFGMPFVKWRQQVRILAALKWLNEGRTVLDVALDLGYQTQSAFTAMFRRQTGMTPTEWQNCQKPLKVGAS